MTYWILSIIGLAIGGMAWEAKMFIDAHNKSVEKIVSVATEETEKLLKQAVLTDRELIQALNSEGQSFETLAWQVRDFIKQKERRELPNVEVVPTKTEKKKLNMQEYVYSLEYAKDTFAVSPVEKKALDVIITRIKETV